MITDSLTVHLRDSRNSSNYFCLAFLYTFKCLFFGPGGGNTIVHYETFHQNIYNERRLQLTKMHSTSEIERATENIIEILNSHNARRRTSLDIDVSNRPCSEIITNTDSADGFQKDHPQQIPRDLRPLSPSFLVELTPSPNESPRQRKTSFDRSQRSHTRTSTPRVSRRKSMGGAPLPSAIGSLGSRSEVIASPPAVAPPSPSRRSCDAQRHRPSSASRSAPSSPGRAQRFSASEPLCDAPERPRPRNPAEAQTRTPSARDRDFLRSIAPLPLPHQPGPNAAAGDDAPPAARAHSRDACRRPVIDSGGGGAHGCGRGAGADHSAAGGAGAGGRRRRLWSRLLGCLGSRCGGAD